MTTEPGRVSDAERRRRWRLVLGGAASADGEVGSSATQGDGSGPVDDEAAEPGEPSRGRRVDRPGMTDVPLHGDDARIDAALGAVYDRRPRRGRARDGGLGASAPSVARWLGDIRRYFPTTVVQVLQRDAIDRLQLHQLLLEPELLDAIEPDLQLATLLVSLGSALPDDTRESARSVVRAVVAEIERRFAARTREAIDGAITRSQRTRRPRPADIDWLRTIEANLRHYVPDRRTVVPERIVGHSRRRRGLARDVIVAIDQSASMADSVVYASVYCAVLASMPSLRTQVVAFDTTVVDLTPLAVDPVDLAFGVQLGGGTDIASAVAYCRRLVANPTETVLVVVSDLFEGGSPSLLVERMAELVRAGTTVVVLLALSDAGAPSFDHGIAAALADVGVASLACTPDAFPELFAAAIEGRDVASWANAHGLHTAVAPRPDPLV